MKKLLLIIALVFASLSVKAQLPPLPSSNFKLLTSYQFKYYTPYNSKTKAVWMYMGAAHGWMELMGFHRGDSLYKAKADTVLLSGWVSNFKLQQYRKLNDHDSLSTLQEKAYSSLTGKPTLGTAAAQDVGYFQIAGTYSTDIHGNITALNAVSGTNTGDNAANTNAGLVHIAGTETITGAKSFSSKINITGGEATLLGLKALQLPTGVNGIDAGLSVRFATGESIVQFGNNLSDYYTGNIDVAKAGSMVRLDTRDAAPIPGGHAYPAFQIQTRAAGAAYTAYKVPVQISGSAQEGSLTIASTGIVSTYYGLIATNGTITGTQLISNIPTGTAALSIASTTVIPNLNASLLEGHNAAYFQTAGNYLSLAGGTMTGGITNSTSINPLTTLAESWIGPSSTTGVYFKGGNVGIGTTTPGTFLHTYHSVSTENNYLKIENGQSNAQSALELKTAQTNADWIMYVPGSSSNLRFYNTGASGQTAGDRMTITSDGNVGIGFTAPLSRVAINGGLHVGGESDAGDNNILADGSITAPSIISTGTMTLKGYTVGTLPAGAVGMIAYVTDALAPTFLVTTVGGGTIVTPCFFDGVSWKSF